MSYIELTSDETNQFKLGLEYSFIDKNKHIKKNLHANVESLPDKVTENLENGKREGFHELLRAYVDIFTKNIHATRDNTYKNLKRIINDTNVAVVSGYKESCVAIMNRSDYFKKLKLMIDESVHNLVYIVTKDRTLKILSCSVDFYTITLRNMNTTKRCYQRQINQNNCMELLKHKFYNTADTRFFYNKTIFLL